LSTFVLTVEEGKRVPRFTPASFDDSLSIMQSDFEKGSTDPSPLADARW